MCPNLYEVSEPEELRITAKNLTEVAQAEARPSGQYREMFRVTILRSQPVGGQLPTIWESGTEGRESKNQLDRYRF